MEKGVETTWKIEGATRGEKIAPIVRGGGIRGEEMWESDNGGKKNPSRGKWQKDKFVLGN